MEALFKSVLSVRNWIGMDCSPFSATGGASEARLRFGITFQLIRIRV